MLDRDYSTRCSTCILQIAKGTGASSSCVCSDPRSTLNKLLLALRGGMRAALLPSAGESVPRAADFFINFVCLSALTWFPMELCDPLQLVLIPLQVPPPTTTPPTPPPAPHTPPCASACTSVRGVQLHELGADLNA
jgi:hypothetical protein